MEPQTSYNNKENPNKEKKRKYLLENIKEKDREAFVEFISFKRFEGENLDNWGYEELTEVVSEFLVKLTDNNKVKEEINNLQVTYVNNESQPGDNMSKHVCKKLPKIIISDFSDLKITINNPELIETGLLASNYILYQLSTEPIAYSVKRRYSDFEKLRELLVKMFYGICIPSLPHKKVGNRRFEDDYINKRMHLLNLFLQSIIDNPVLRSSDIINNFITTKDRVVFEKKVSDLSAIKAPQYLDDCYSLSGELLLNFNNINEVNQVNKNNSNNSNNIISNNSQIPGITSNTNNNNSTNNNNNNNTSNISSNNENINTSSVKETTKMYTKILKETNKCFKEFDNCIKKAYLHLDDIQTKLEQLSIISMRMGVTEQTTFLYIEGKNFFNKYKKIMFSQKSTITKYFKEQLKYNRMNFESFIKENIKEYEELNSKFNNENSKLLSKKEKLWTSGDISKWDLPTDLPDDKRLVVMKNKEEALKYMLSKDTSCVVELRNKLGYLNYMIYEQYNRLISSNSKNFKKSMIDFSEVFYPSITEGVTAWTNFSMGINQISDKRVN